MTDLRVERTERAIQSAFVKIVNTSGFESVTITGLAQEAMINRLTFYKHYTDKYDLAQAMIEQFGVLYEQVIQKRLKLSRENMSLRDVLETLTPELNGLFVKRRAELRALQTIQVGTLTLNNRLEQVINRYMPQIMHHEISTLERRLLVGILAILLNYVVDEQHVPDYRDLQQTLADIQKVLQ